LLACVTQNRLFLNHAQEEQVKAGLAYHYAKYSGNCPHRDAIVTAEAIARSNRVGVWSQDYEKPWDYRKKYK
jgi:endonuclease YncB( thermonuclease family)